MLVPEAFEWRSAERCSGLSVQRRSEPFESFNFIQYVSGFAAAAFKIN